MKGMPITRASRKYFGVKCSGGNQKGKIKAVLLHSTESSTAAGAAAYLHTRTDGSVHLVVDNISAYRLANDSTITCGCFGYNTGVVHIEQAGFAGWSIKQWRRNNDTVIRAAFHAAKELRKHNIRPRRMKSQADFNRGGYGFHIDAAKYTASTHTDPGPHYPYLRFAVYLRFFYHHPKARKPEER